jgi:hypothetical protein
MRSKRKFSFAPEILGIIVTAIMLLSFGPYLVLDIIKNGDMAAKEIMNALLNWNDDPTGFFLCYLTGYALVWWKPLRGSLIIMLSSLLVIVFNINNQGFILFAFPTFLVGYFYIETWYKKRKKRQTGTD